jgi:flagellar basal-body rod protein FlgG
MDVSRSIAVSGLLAHQRQLEVISNNIANAGTTAFKRSRANPTDAGYQAGLTAPVGPRGEDVRINGVGEGVKLADVQHDFLPGVIQVTGNPLDVALDGDGFFELALPDGQVGYTRDGTFQLDGQGFLVTGSGHPVLADDAGQLRVPEDTIALRFEPAGDVVATLSDGNEQVLGRLGIAQFRNPEGLLANGQNVWVASDASGQPVPVGTDAPNAPSVVGGAVETSNVDVADEFTRMIQAQRGYQLNLRVVQAWDEIERMSNELRR